MSEVMAPDRRPVLVVLPGLDGTDVFLRPFLAALPASIRTRFVGYPPLGANTYTELLNVVLSAVADLPPFFVLASSFSGPIAVRLAAANPERVKGIVFAASFIKSPRPDLSRVRAAFVTPVVWTIRLLRRLPVGTKTSQSENLRRGKAETWAAVSAKTLAIRARQLLTIDVSDLFRETAHPILCLTFAHDRTVTPASAESIRSCRPSTRLTTLPGDHYGLFSHPAAAAAAVVEFIESIEAQHGTIR